MREKIIRMEIGEKVDSDHHPVEVTLIGGKERRRKGGGRRVWRGWWDEEGTNVFRREMEEVRLEEGDIQEEWEKMEDRIKRTIVKMEEERGEKEERGEDGEMRIAGKERQR